MQSEIASHYYDHNDYADQVKYVHLTAPVGIHTTTPGQSIKVPTVGNRLAYEVFMFVQL
jgi:hypothetical protein